MMQAAYRVARLAPFLRYGTRIAPPLQQAVANIGVQATSVDAHRHACRQLHGTAVGHSFVTRITDQVRGNMEERNEKKMFDAQMSFFLDRSNAFDGDGYVEFLKTMKAAGGLGGFKEHLPWNKQNPALQDFNDREAVLNAMTPAERRDTWLRPSAKKRIAQTTEKSVEFIEGVLEHVSAMRAVRNWIVKRDDAGLPLPKNSVELRTMITAPGSGLKNERRRGGRKQMRPGLGKKLRR